MNRPQLADLTSEQVTLLPASHAISASRSSHQVELMEIVALAAMDAELGGRQFEDQPAVAAVDAGNFQDVPEECAVSLLVA